MITTETRQKKIRNFAALLNTVTKISKVETPYPVIFKNEAENDSFFETRTVLQGFVPAQSINQKLNAMIEASAAFDVAEENFEVIGGDRLTEYQRQYLVANEKEVLCTLHQRLLLKHWFYDSPELLEDFAFDIYEREAILVECDGFYSYETYFAAVRETSQKWFAQLLTLT